MKNSNIPREVLAEAEFKQALDNIQAKYGVFNIRDR